MNILPLSSVRAVNVQVGGSGVGSLEMRPLSWKSPSLRELGVHCSEERGLNNIIQDFWKN